MQVIKLFSKVYKSLITMIKIRVAALLYNLQVFRSLHADPQTLSSLWLNCLLYSLLCIFFVIAVNKCCWFLFKLVISLQQTFDWYFVFAILLYLLLYLSRYLDQETAKRIVDLPSQAATWYYLSNH